MHHSDWKVTEPSGPLPFAAPVPPGHRKCTTCPTVQPEEKYKKRASTGRQAGTRQAQCNRCLYVLFTRPNMETKLVVVHALKVERGCMDCGYSAHPAALEFDHRPGTVKLFNIGEKVGSYSMTRIMEEIAKCDVVCANCHAIRTVERRTRVGLASIESHGGAPAG